MAAPTPKEKQDAALIMVTLPGLTTEPTGEYKQIIRYSPDGKHSLARDVYSGPQGNGYIERVSMAKADGVYYMQIHTGPETYRDTINGVWILEGGPE